ncbi:hypothetical protein [Marinivivus vitaminiproducens]|uniref:hypothetical protein n=1 Tax=Marinivivus vitaminiproducens TaxID=3035935 RepID=UPI0027AB1D92|nr:hypothetical protein P4R82_20645 [Geminicoccaceae bacterium SCSIO 64248]
MTAPLDFSHDGFRRLLTLIREHGYEVRRLDDRFRPEDRRTVFLRFDVDISPRNALALGRIAAEIGCCASFFFQLNAETYNGFAPSTLEVIRELRDRGHCVGLHVDQRLTGDEEAEITQTLKWFQRCVAPIDPVVSFHRPGPSVLGRRYRAFHNAYAAETFEADRYLSDSRRSLAFQATLLAWLEEGRSPIQLLLHPEWWQHAPSVEAIWNEILARRERELELYLAENFAKVFGHLVAHEDRDFRL